MVTVMEAGFVVQGRGRVEVLLACLPGSCRDHLPGRRSGAQRRLLWE